MLTVDGETSFNFLLNIMPILSIIVPTKNRYEYLRHLVRVFCDSNSSEVELIIQDNSDNQSADFLRMLDEVCDKRIKYNYTHGWISVVDNCDIAVAAATAEYLCMLGDDDAIIVDLALSIVKYAKINNIDAVVVNKAQYYWPDTSHGVWGQSLAGKVFYEKYAFNAYPVAHACERKKVFKEGATGSLNRLPRVYHGFVSRRSMLALKKQAGTFFPGPSPDMANAIALSFVVNKVVYIDAPSIISGHGKKSTGGMGGEKTHHGNIENQTHLPRGAVDCWDHRIPRFWSGPTIYADSVLKAIASVKTETLNKFNFDYLYAYCLIFESTYLNRILDVVLKKPSRIPLVLWYIVIIFVYRILNFVLNVFKIKCSRACRIEAANTYLAQSRVSAVIGSLVFPR